MILSKQVTMKKPKAYSILIRKVPNANDIRVNNFNTSCEGLSNKVITGRESIPISYVVDNLIELTYIAGRI